MKKESKILKTKLITVISLTLSFFVLVFIIWFLNYKERIYPGVYFAETKLSGKTLFEARDFFSNKTEDLENNGITFKTEEGRSVVKKKAELLDSSLNYSFISFFPEESALAAFDSSQNNNFFLFLNHFLKPSSQKKIKAKFKIEKIGLDYFLDKSFPELIISPENASFSLKQDFLTKEDVLVINQEKTGKTLNYELAFFDLEKNLENLSLDEIIIKTISAYPSFYKKDLEELKPEAELIIKTSKKLELHYLDLNNEPQVWNIRAPDLIYWLELEKNNFSQVISLNQAKIIAYLEEYLSPRIDREIILPKLEIVAGKVSDWRVGKNGQELNLKESAIKISQAFSFNQEKVELLISELEVDSFVSENEFKIKEILGTGHSSFRGSSANRIHNIKVGTDVLHGLLIKPDEEFSLVKALGEIDANSGYKTELVIKGNKTVPEYGGGLCQVATTMFRSALQSGLPITMRQNHSYRVSYYEPAGTDATIYNPWPDFRFINDTGNYILIQGRTEGSEHYFDFWGIKDGRTVEISEPVIYNIIKPAPTKYIESEDLAPGEKKCSEGSHNGASTYFDYTVTYPEGASSSPVVEKRFSSYYVPWQAVCLIGKKEAPQEELENGEDIENPINSEHINDVVEDF